MTIVPVTNMNDPLNALLDRVESGEAIALMRDGTVVASLVKITTDVVGSHAAQAAERIRERRKSAVVGEHDLTS